MCVRFEQVALLLAEIYIALADFGRVRALVRVHRAIVDIEGLLLADFLQNILLQRRLLWLIILQELPLGHARARWV